MKTQKELGTGKLQLLQIKNNIFIKCDKYFGLDKTYNGLLQCLSVKLKITDLVEPKYQKTNYKTIEKISQIKRCIIKLIQFSFPVFNLLISKNTVGDCLKFHKFGENQLNHF